MNKKNVDTYFNILNNTFNSIQDDYNFIYENINTCEDIYDRKLLIEEIKKLKNKLVMYENINENENIITNNNKITNENINNNKNKNKNNENIINNKNNENIINNENNKLKEIIKNNELKIQALSQENIKYKEIIKDLKNEIIDLKGSIRIFLRIKKSDNNSCIEIYNNTLKILNNKKYHNFGYNKIFDINSNQEDIFNEIQNIIESVYEGYKICLFVYGQTGSGKTYTMLGNDKYIYNNNLGIIYRSIDKIFHLKKEYENLKYSCEVSFSCIEIYNEEIINLNNENIINTCKEGYDLINKISKLRITGSTNCNLQSSRSHLIINIKILIKNNIEKREGSICFIDLAGSERLNQSKVEGKRLKETLNINKSLSSLGDVFLAILRKDSHIPFRNSKLTFYLQDYLKGNCRVAMILNINSDQKYINETISTLRFGYKISEVQLGGVERNVIKKV